MPLGASPAAKHNGRTRVVPRRCSTCSAIGILLGPCTGDSGHNNYKRDASRLISCPTTRRDIFGHRRNGSSAVTTRRHQPDIVPERAQLACP
jgi:hypothetical protein